MKTTLITLGFLAAALAGNVSGRIVPDHATANLVLGQADFDDSQPDTTSSSLDNPGGVAMDPTTGKIFVADSGNHRVLRYGSAASLQNGAAAEAVLGQDGFANAPVPATSSQGMNRPVGVFVDHLGRLWVADRSNARVLRFSNASTAASYSAADRVYGQADFTSNTFTVTASGMINPTAVWVDAGDRLWVADEAACRVLRFDDISNKENGAAADGVLGQADFITGAQGSGATGLERPAAIAISRAGSLFVACERANRVMRFNRAATLENGAEANCVLGQADFSGSSAGLSATQMSGPKGLALGKDDSLWVCDQFNNRMLRFDRASSKTSGAAADGVVGQPDFVTGAEGYTADGLRYPEGSMFVDDLGRLWVSDRYNSRVLRFPAVISKPVVTITPPVPKETTKKSITIKGAASDPNGISKVRYQINGGALKTAKGSSQWRITSSLKEGDNKISIFAEDPWGDLSRKKVVRITRK